MELLSKHVILATADSCEDARKQVAHFFERSSLVQYDALDIDDTCHCGTDTGFSEQLEKVLARNKEILVGFVEELRASGFRECDDLPTIPQGYPSKILHIITHFLDGFIGIDSAFYNLVDDSHWLMEETSNSIRKNPERYWLFSVDGYSMSPRKETFFHQ